LIAPSAIPPHRGHPGDFQKFGGWERRQARGQARRQHRPAGAGRADHQVIFAMTRAWS